MVFLLLVLGMVLLMKGADLFVDGSASVARKLKVPSVIIGLTIVALGTSLPEASVSITAGLMGSNEIAISNIVGSNIFNTLVVVGTSAIITPFLMDKDILNRDLKINILVSILLSIFVLNGMLNRFEGIIFLVGLVLFILNLIRSAKKNRVEDEEVETLSGIKCLIYIVIGVACIIWGGDITVDSAKQIAAMLGMSDTLIGLTVVSIGTSLPELVTSVVAARKGESGLSLGNAIGSNIMNILFILGASSTIHPIAATPQNIIDTFVLIGVSLLIYGIAKKGDTMTRKKGIFTILVYVIYMIYIIVRQACPSFFSNFFFEFTWCFVHYFLKNLGKVISCAPKIQPHGLILLCPGARLWFSCDQMAEAMQQMGQDYIDIESVCFKASFNNEMAKHPDPFTEAKGYNGPVMLMRADDDDQVDEETCIRYAQGYQNAKFHKVSNGGHDFASIEARDKVEETISSFIKEHI